VQQGQAPIHSPSTPPRALELTGVAAGTPVRARSAVDLPPLVSIRRYIARLVVLDAGVATIVTFLAVRLRLDPSQMSGLYSVLTVLLPLPWVMIVLLCGGYDRRLLVVGPEEYQRVTRAGMWLLAVTAVSSYSTHANLSRALVAVTTPSIIAATLIGRMWARRLLHRRLSAGWALHRVVVAGPADRVHAFVLHLRRNPHAGLRVIGVCVPGRITALEVADGRVPVLGGVGDAADAARRAGADTIAIAGTGALPDGALRRLSWELEGTGMRLIVAPGITDIAGPRILVRPLNGLPLLCVDLPRFSGGRRVLKEVSDRVLASLLLLLLSPLLLGVVLAIRLGDHGPILFPQVRIGHLGRGFVLWKFRTMRVGAEHEREALLALNEHDGVLFKIRCDPRVTRVGRWLRRYSLDELPQLWNVLAGSMSLVGPRPPLPAEADVYPDDVQRRLLVKPGITGLWQVSGRSDLSWEETVRLDLHYVENWSVAMDVMLLWRTVATVLGGSGAY
jgi:exopolysaccharide biosynthesis polyprenyl glycosylphosphotransferase